MRKVAKIFLVFLIIVVILFLSRFGGGFLRGSLGNILLPAGKIFWQAGEKTANSLASLWQAGSLKKDYTRLLNQSFVLMKEVQGLKTAQKENEILRKALSLGLEKKFEMEMVEVVVRNADDTIIISQGSNNGLREKMVVINENGVLVGRVKKVFAAFSLVELISSPKVIFDVNIQAKNEEVLGVAEGTGNLGVRIKMVAKDKEIQAGQKVFTTALGGNFPENLLVGEIESIRKVDAEPFQNGSIVPYFTKTTLNRLLVIKSWEAYKGE